MAQIAHLLVAADLASRAVYPLQRALQLKAESHCQVTVLHVVEHGLTAHIRERRIAEAREELTRWKDGLPEFSQLALDIQIACGDPFAGILERMDIDMPDLVIIGHPGKPNLKELFVGTTTERVVRFADRPVLMVCQHASGPYKRVLVAIDFSHAAGRALESVSRIAPGAEILLVHAWQPPVRGGASDAQAADRANQRLREQEERQVRAIIEQRSLGRHLSLEIVEDESEMAIRRALAHFNADLLAMGTHSRSQLSTAMVGSLAQEFLASGPCDVLVVRG